MLRDRISNAVRGARHIFANLSIRRRVALVAVVPGLTGLALAGIELTRDYEDWREGRTAAAEIAAAGQVGLLVHELQRERGLTISFTAARRNGVPAALVEQRLRVDAQREALGKRLAELGAESSAESISDGIERLQNRLCNIASLREAIDGGTVAPGDAAAYYTAPIGDYIDYVEAAGREHGSAVLRERLMAFSALLRAKEEAGRERGLVAGALAQGAFDGKVRTTVLGLAAAQDAYFAVVARHASPTLRRAVAALQAGATSRAVAIQRARVLGAAALAPADGQRWWTVASARIDAMQAVARRAESELVATAKADANAARFSFFAFAALLMVLGAALGGLVLAVARTLVGPVQALAHATEQMIAGNLAATIAVAETDEEIGQLAARIRQFRDRLVAADSERAAHAAEREAQMARVEARARRVDALTADFDAQVGTALESFALSTRTLLAAARELDERALDSAQRSTAVASASQQTNANVRIVAEATEELSLSIEEIVRQVLASSESMAEAVAEVRRAHGDMAVLRQAADEIGAIVSLIGDIAEQTNILALNATIEAARADAAGYGFAVVANEVRALANQTAEATRSIARSVGEVTAKTRRAGEGMDRIAATIRAAEQAGTAISAALEQQSVAARNIAENVQEAACGVAQVDSNIVAIEQASSAARSEVESVVGAADTFGARAGTLDRSVQDFLAAIRAA